MAKKQTNRGRGRPLSENAMSQRVLVRIDVATKAALQEYTARLGIGADSSVVRMLIVKELRAAGLLK